MKKYGLVLLLLIFSRSVFAEGCFFEYNNPQSIYLTLGNTQQVSLSDNTSGLQLIQTYDAGGGGALKSYWNETGTGTALSVFQVPPISSSLRTTKTSNGAVLFPIDNVSTAQESGFAFAFKVNNGSRSAYITQIGTIQDSAAGKNILFSNLTKEECNSSTWSFTVELWHVDNNYRDERKLSAIKPIEGPSYFALYFPGYYRGVMTNSTAIIYFAGGTSIPVAPVTCNLSVNSNMIDFGNLYLRDPDSWPTKEVILTSNNCSQVGTAQLRILSNGHQYSSKVLALGNQLTGDNAAKDILVRFTTKSGASINLDTSEWDNGLSCDTDTLSFASDGFISSCTHTVIANIYPLWGGEATTGDFETSATFSVTYY